jgi:hypothetical protein|tara:strand:+ start:679 stop:1020 length:342 start_codon:yes stop_codon:yes gene_type:complete
MSKEDITKYEFKKGESGNPSGRPKGSLNRSTIAKKWLEVLSQEELEDGQVKWLSNEEAMTLSLIKKARNGDVNAYKALMDSAYGTAKDTVDINSNEKRSIDFKHLISGIKAKH